MEYAKRDMTVDKKKRELFLMQKETLIRFLGNGAITQTQFDKSYGDLKTKMHLDDNGDIV